MKRIILYLLVLGGAFTAPPQLAAQTDSLLWKDYDFLKLSDAWLTSQNAAGLSRLTVGHLSDAQISIISQNGGFVNYDEAPKVLIVDAGVEAFYRLNRRMALYGQIHYENFAGRQMAGSAFIDPSRMPFDIVEDSLTNTGQKHRDTYRLVGAFSGTVWKNVSLGLKVDFKAANYAKYKDLRHKNSLMDLSVTAGITSPVSRYFQVGANLLYRRNTESVSFATYGNADKVYKSFVNYGAFIGKIEQFGENGYTDKNRENPFFSEHKGFGVQLAVIFSPKLTWYNDFTYALREGYFGKKSSYTISYNQHRSHEYTYRGRFSWKQGQNRHDFNVAIEVENLKNFSNSYRSASNQETSSTYYEYFTPVKLSDKIWAEATFFYEGNFGIKNLLPTWHAQLGLETTQRKQSAYQYPYFRRQHLKNTRFFVNGSRNVSLGNGILTAKAAFSFQNGSGKPCEDGTFATPSDKQKAPPTMEAYFWRDNVFFTAPQYTISAAVRYAFVPERIRMKTYVEANFSFRKANSSNEYLEGRQRRTLNLTLGCTF